eukprot:IDg20814t1
MLSPARFLNFACLFGHIPLSLRTVRCVLLLFITVQLVRFQFTANVSSLVTKYAGVQPPNRSIPLTKHLFSEYIARLDKLNNPQTIEERVGSVGSLAKFNAVHKLYYEELGQSGRVQIALNVVLKPRALTGVSLISNGFRLPPYDTGDAIAAAAAMKSASPMIRAINGSAYKDVDLARQLNYTLLRPQQLDGYRHARAVALATNLLDKAFTNGGTMGAGIQKCLDG